MKVAFPANMFTGTAGNTLTKTAGRGAQGTPQKKPVFASVLIAAGVCPPPIHTPRLACTVHKRAAGFHVATPLHSAALQAILLVRLTRQLVGALNGEVQQVARQREARGDEEDEDGRPQRAVAGQHAEDGVAGRELKDGPHRCDGDDGRREEVRPEGRLERLVALRRGLLPRPWGEVAAARLRPARNFLRRFLARRFLVAAAGLRANDGQARPFRATCEAGGKPRHGERQRGWRLRAGPSNGALRAEGDGWERRDGGEAEERSHGWG
eukprot:TRINITY_DN63454_c0_g1_i1.p2 TRINITY_DN63454_c0_g1~~TRINITY_DN63454_c0_g1_i1.p2  ORF type:complete len:267 (+),score=-33.40 TRINITY_DN63454_c0_g1_i1:101-901(+)